MDEELLDDPVLKEQWPGFDEFIRSMETMFWGYGKGFRFTMWFDN